MSNSTPQALVNPERLSCSTICFKDFPLEAALDAIKSLGIQHVDLAAIPGFCPHFDFVDATQAEEDTFVSKVVDSGLAVHTFTTFFGHPNELGSVHTVLLRAGRRNIRLARKLHAKGIVFTCGLYRDREQYPLSEDIEIIAQVLRPLAKECEEAGLQAMVEAPHKGSLLRTPEDAEQLWQSVAPENLVPILDVNHYEAAGWSAARAVSFIGAKQIGIIHLRDGVGHENRHILGTGQIDFRKLFEALNQGGYPGLYSFEFSDTTGSVEGNKNAIRKSIDYLLSL